MNLKKIYLVVLAALCLIPNLIWGQLTVNTNLTPQQLVQNVLLGSGITAFNITYTGAPNAIGSFNGANSNIGIGSGVIMTSGDIANAPGPNNLGGAGTPNQTPGDNDLNNLGGGNTFDGCILEFDFIPLSNNIKFNFAFGSEEYNEFVNTSFNDVFAFFLSGPGIVGLKNIALIPNTTLPVSINNINNGNANAGPCMNCTYFYDNFGGTTVQYDAFTTVLTAQSAVIACDTFHIKLAIADVADGVLDSGVLLEAGSFTGGIPNVLAQFSSAYAANDSSIIEGCTDVTVTFSYPNPVPNDVYIKLNISGTAVNGVDYNQLPDSVKIAAGDSSGFISIYPTPDGLTEGTETIIFTQTNTPFCLVPPPPLLIKIKDKVPFTVSVSNDTTICPGQSINLIATYLSAQQPVTYNWDNGADLDSIYSVSPTSTTTYNVTITDACGQPLNETVTVYVLPNGPVLTLSDTTICPGQSVTLSAGIAQGAAPFIYNWNNGAANTPTYTVSPNTTTTYSISVTDNCNQQSTGSITVNVSSGPPALTLTPGDTAICPGQSLTLTVNASGAGPYFYNWNNGAAQTASYNVTPANTTTYIITVTDNCAQQVSDTVTVSVLASAPIVAITPNDTTLCKGTTLNLSGTAVNGAGTLIYNWNNGSGNAANYSITATTSSTVMLAITDQCGNTGMDSIKVTSNDPPQGTVTSADSVCNDNPVLFQFVGTAGSNAAYSWSFVNASPATATGAGPINTTWASAGLQTYTVTVNDGVCPKLELSGEVQINPCAIVIPNVFTPNGDLLNETFFIKNLESFPNTKVKIFNRWGRILLDSNNYKNDWKATDAPDGVYYYTVTIYNGTEFNGTVSILRK